MSFPTPTRISLPGVELEVFEAGQENAGRPIVLCHGWPDLARTWRHQMPALAEAGYHVIAPNQRGYGGSSRPPEVTDYDITHLSGDLVALLDHFGYEDATFVGHDWGAMVVWGTALLHPRRVRRIINLSLPYPARGDRPWIAFMEELLGEDYYFVHFNRRPGVAEAMFEEDTHRFLRNLYRKGGADTPLLDLAREETPPGEPLLGDAELATLVAAFEDTGFESSIHWYRNMDRNWHLLGEVDPILAQPTLMIHGDQDAVRPSPVLLDFVPNAEVVHLDAGHWIHQERPEETTELMLGWLARQGAPTP